MQRKSRSRNRTCAQQVAASVAAMLGIVRSGPGEMRRPIKTLLITGLSCAAVILLAACATLTAPSAAPASDTPSAPSTPTTVAMPSVVPTKQGAEQAIAGYVGADADGVTFIQWVERDSQLTGQVYQTSPSPELSRLRSPLYEAPYTKSTTNGFTGVHQGGNVAITFSPSGSVAANWFGKLQGDGLTLTYPDARGRPHVLTLHRGTLAEYKQLTDSMDQALISDVSTDGDPIDLKVDGNVDCRFVGGATFGYWGLRANYECSDGSWLYGSPSIVLGEASCSGGKCILGTRKLVQTDTGLEPAMGVLEWVKIINESKILTNDPRCAGLDDVHVWTCLRSLPTAISSTPAAQRTSQGGPTPIPARQATADAIATRDAEATTTERPAPPLNPSAIPATPATARRAPSVMQIGLEMSRTVEAEDQNEHFTPGQQITVSDGQGGALTAIVGTRYPTADGYGQLVFFWHNDTFLGWNASKETMAVLKIASPAPGTFDVTYEHYAPNDSACCPSLPAVTVTYRWNGTALASNGDPPNLLSSVKMLP